MQPCTHTQEQPPLFNARYCNLLQSTLCILGHIRINLQLLLFQSLTSHGPYIPVIFILLHFRSYVLLSKYLDLVSYYNFRPSVQPLNILELKSNSEKIRTNVLLDIQSLCLTPNFFRSCVLLQFQSLCPTLRYFRAYDLQLNQIQCPTFKLFRAYVLLSNQNQCPSLIFSFRAYVLPQNQSL